ncbi:MAG: FHA domain-containing protein [bacterium]|nr:FHA domain-containing protein [bacterium]
MKIGKMFVFLFILIGFISMLSSPLLGDKLTEEQMTAYRTRPAVVLVYSGMYVKIAMKSGQSFQVPRYGSGSGFFINPDGYLVTNGHVVDTYVKYMDDKNGYAQQVFNNFVIQKITTEFKQAKGREPTQQELNAEYGKFIRAQQPKITDHGSINWVVLSNSETHKFEVKKFSPSIPEGGKDIAVLKVERENCPVIMLGDSAKLSLQEPVFTIGFPAVVDPQRFPLLGKENTLNSSITRGAISALKTDFKGMSVIQHDAATSPGNSGGPTVNTKGRVIGVHSYAAREYDGFKFCVPINSAKEFIRDAGIQFNVDSEFTAAFNKLMNAVWEEDWFAARDYVNTTMAYMKNEPDLEKLNQLIIKKIDEMGAVEKMWTKNKGIVIIAVVLIVLIIVVLFIAFKPSGSKQEKVAPPAPPAPPAPAPAVPEDKTVVDEQDGTVLEGEITGSLTVLLRGEDKGTFNITAEGVILGRDPNSVSVLIADNIVSKNHLKILPKGDQFFIVDLGSTNGTYVNGEKITETLVNPDDMVQLGKKGDVKLVLKK